jgi:hypothetical protein
MRTICCSVTRTAELVGARGEVRTDAAPSTIVVPATNGDQWSCELPLGKYIFICGIVGRASANIDASVADVTAPAAPVSLGTDRVPMLGRLRGTNGHGVATVFFTVT